MERVIWLKQNQKRWEGIPSVQRFPAGAEALKRDTEQWEAVIAEMRKAGLYNPRTKTADLVVSVHKLAYQVWFIQQPS